MNFKIQYTIMKKLNVLLISLIITVSNLYAQEAATAAERTNAKENYVFVTGSTGFSNHNQLVAIAKIEYSRQIKNNWFWGVTMQNSFGFGRMLTYDYAGMGPDPYRNTVYQYIYTLSGMAYYRLPIVKSRLYLRPGLGLGMGYHQIKDHINNDSRLKDKVLPYLNAELTWLLRVSKHIDLKFSPTLIGIPQSISFSPVKLGAPTDVCPFNIEAGFSLGVGVRF